MKKLRIGLLAFIIVLASAFTAFADARIQFGDPKTKVGAEFEVTMKINSLTSGKKLGSSSSVTLEYDPQYLEFLEGTNASGGAGTVIVKGQTEVAETWAYSLKFRALSAGSTNISVKDFELYDADSKAIETVKQGSSAIIIEGDAGSSINASLSSLKIHPGTLNPDFSSDITEYTATVGEDCDKIAVSANPADSNAKVLISGNSELQMGENTIECKVTAQDGSTTKVYRIVVAKKEGTVEDPVAEGQVSIDGQEYEVVDSFDENILPEGFTADVISYNGKDVMAGKDDRGLTIVYLVGMDGTGDFYAYDKDGDSWSPYAQINVAERSVTIAPIGNAEIPEGFEDTTLDLNGKKVHGWIWANDPDQKYCMVYGMNADGEKDFYRYDLKEKTIQRYFGDPQIEKKDVVSQEEYDEAVNKYNELLKEYNLRFYILIGLAVICGILIIALIILAIAGRRGSDRPSSGSSYYTAPAAKPAKAKKKSRQDKFLDELEEDEEDVYRKPKVQVIEREEELSAEEQYMRGVEPDHTEESVVMEHLTDTAEKQIRNSIAREVGAKASDSVNAEDDDFTTFDI